jgi:hypothetical protein
MQQTLPARYATLSKSKLNFLSGWKTMQKDSISNNFYFPCRVKYRNGNRFKTIEKYKK